MRDQNMIKGNSMSLEHTEKQRIDLGNFFESMTMHWILDMVWIILITTNQLH